MFVRSIHTLEAQPRNAAGPERSAEAVYICQIPGCTQTILSRHFMCARHWSMVRAETRAEVSHKLNAWISGMDNLYPFMIARLKAIIQVGKLHGEDMCNFEARLLRVQSNREEFEKGRCL